METLVGVYESDEDESIPDTSADIILDLSGEIRSGLDTTNHAALIDKIRYVRDPVSFHNARYILIELHPV